MQELKHHNIFQVYLPRSIKSEADISRHDWFAEEYYLYYGEKVENSNFPIDYKRNPLDVILYPSFAVLAIKYKTNDFERFQFVNDCIDSEFTNMLLRFNPAYKCEVLLDYHLENYKGKRIDFIKHIKYHILSKLRKKIQADGKIALYDSDQLESFLEDYIKTNWADANTCEPKETGSKELTKINSLIIQIIAVFISLLILLIAVIANWEKIKSFLF